MTDFSQVIVHDDVSAALLHCLMQEGMLQVRRPRVLTSRRKPRPRDIEDALALLVLFDKVAVPDQQKLGMRAPALEKENVVELFETEIDLSVHRQPGATCYIHNQLLEIESVLPLALDGTLKAVGRIPFWFKLAQMTHISVYRLLEATVDYGLAFYRRDDTAIKHNVLTRVLPREVLRFYDRRLSRGEYRKSGRLDSFESLLLSLDIAQLQIALLQRLSVARNAGVATRKYTSLARHVISAKHTVPLDLTKGFLLLRCALNEEFGCLPHLTCIAQAIELRKDPNLRSLRTQLALFHGRLAAGDYNAVPALRMEVRRAARALNRFRHWDGALRWVTYLSVPAASLDLLLGNPVVGGALTVLSVTATAVAQRQQSKSGWVLFGRGAGPGHIPDF